MAKKNFNLEKKKPLTLDYFLKSVTLINGKVFSKDKFAFYQVLKSKKIIENQEISVNNKIYLLNAGPIFFEGEVEEVIITFENVTQELHKQFLQKMFIKMVSHELKQPLGLIKAYTYYLKKYFDKNPSSHQNYIKEIETQIRTITQMLDDVSDATRYSLNAFAINKKSVEIKSLILAILNELKFSFTQKELIYNDKIKEKELFLSVDQVRIRQAVSNLIINAFKYSKEKVILKLEKNKKEIIVSVQDFGLGISKEETGKIFEPYYRIHDKSGKKTSGLGLGLTLVKNIMERHEGLVTLESKKGKGSIFKLIIPLHY